MATTVGVVLRGVLRVCVLCACVLSVRLCLPWVGYPGQKKLDNQKLDNQKKLTDQFSYAQPPL